MSDKLGNWIRAARVKRRLSGSELSKLLGVHRATVWRVERGEKLPSHSLLKKMCAKLDLDADLCIKAVKEELIKRWARS